jgi:hypothetical protein
MSARLVALYALIWIVFAVTMAAVVVVPLALVQLHLL